MVAIAQQKAGAKYGSSFERASTLLIGDTTRDVQAGLAGGALVLGVATGGYHQDELRAAGADAVLPNLEDTALVVATCCALLDLS
ncbi:MAG: HAD family hydrolase [Micromonosporaceae bacterium]